MSLDNFNIFALLAALALGGICFLAFSKFKRVLDYFSASFGNSKVNESLSSFAFIRLMALTGFILAIVAWFRPVGQSEEVEHERKGIDIVVALDVSDSMRARDVKPNRMTRAKRELEDLLDRIRGDRVALVAFSGVAFLETPLTLDYGTFSLFLNDIQAGFIPVKGTNIEAALLKSLETLSVNKGNSNPVASNRGRAILLITDGEDFEGNWKEIKTRAKDSETSIFIIGVGTEKGGTIPLTRGFKKDQNGKPVITKLNRQALSDLAEATGGKYVDVTGSTMDSYQIYDLGLKAFLEENDLEKQKYTRKAEFYQLPLFLSILALAISRFRYLGFFIALLVLPFLKPQDVWADSKIYNEAKTAFDKADYNHANSILQEMDNKGLSDFNSKMAQGSTEYRLGAFENASKHFQEAFSLAENQSDKAKALYNSGNALVQQEKLKEAVKTYKEALELNPADKELASNLKYAEKLLQQEQNQQNQDQKDKDQENKEQKNKEQQKKDQQDQSQSDSESDQQESNQDQSEQDQQDSGEKDSEKNDEQSEEQDNEEQTEEKEPSEQEESEQDSNPSEGEGSEGEESEKEDQKQQSILNQMLGGVKENTSASRQHKARKALKELKRENLKPPSKDW